MCHFSFIACIYLVIQTISYQVRVVQRGRTLTLIRIDVDAYILLSLYSIDELRGQFRHSGSLKYFAHFFVMKVGMDLEPLIVKNVICDGTAM